MKRRTNLSSLASRACGPISNFTTSVELLNYDLAPDGKRFAIFPELKAPAGREGELSM